MWMSELEITPSVFFLKNSMPVKYALQQTFMSTVVQCLCNSRLQTIPLSCSCQLRAAVFLVGRTVRRIEWIESLHGLSHCKGFEILEF